ncbi:MAG: nucleotidyltransferase [Acidobacteriota bacterium]|nr:MAG: nucleotidyltransferase [Acidobacteriota bacterium]
MLNQDYKDMLSSLKEEKVEFIVVGAFALAGHGFPRATGDIDIWVRNTGENAEKIIRSLARFGAPISDLSIADLTTSDLVIQIGVEPCRIDIITGVNGLEFDEAWKNRLRINVDNIDFDILSKQDLLKNKLAAGREKDLGDIAWLKKNIVD